MTDPPRPHLAHHGGSPRVGLSALYESGHPNTTMIHSRLSLLRVTAHRLYYATATAGQPQRPDSLGQSRLSLASPGPVEVLVAASWRAHHDGIAETLITTLSPPLLLSPTLLRSRSARGRLRRRPKGGERVRGWRIDGRRAPPPPRQGLYGRVVTPPPGSTG